MVRIRSIAVMGAIALAFVAGALVGPALLSTAIAGVHGQANGTMPEACAEMHEQCAAMGGEHHAQCEAMMEGMDPQAMQETCMAMMGEMDHAGMHEMCQGMMGMMNGMGNGMMRGMMGR